MNAEIERLNARCDARGEQIELLKARLARVRQRLVEVNASNSRLPMDGIDAELIAIIDGTADSATDDRFDRPIVRLNNYP
jgi:hypothetical protein